MEISQRNSYVANFISNKQKCHVFLFNLLFVFSSTKLENGGQDQSYRGERGWGGGGLVSEEGWRWQGKGAGG
jgi:hypothetical protein